MTELMQRRMALMGAQSGERILTGIVTVGPQYTITIPAAATDNFIIINNSLETGTPAAAGEIVELFRLNALSDKVYRVRTQVPAAAPPTLDIAAQYNTAVNQETTTITLTCSNANSTGIAFVGNEYRYFIW